MKEAQLSQLPINAAAFLLSDDKPGTPRKAEGGRRKDKEKRTDLTFSFLSALPEKKFDQFRLTAYSECLFSFLPIS